MATGLLSELWRWSFRAGLALALVLMVTRVFDQPAVADPGLELTLTEQQLEWVGQQVFRNECASRESCLVHWNEGEAFPSLGIGHFIWYPEGVDEPFTESFPDLVRFMVGEGARLPDWLAELHRPGGQRFYAPWPDRAVFLETREHDPGVAGLQRFLANQKGLQAEFLFRRAQAALERVIEAAEDPVAVRQRIKALAETPGGVYVLIDYVNFKGEGLAVSERYHGEGWGLLQVLEQMGDTSGSSGLEQFRTAAATVLTRRAMNAVNDIERERWLPGWLNRLETYQEYNPG